MTLKAFVKKHGSQWKAAAALGIPQATLNRWVNGTSKPKGLYADLLKSRGVVI